MFSANSSAASSDKLYVDDVFSTYLYTGNGSSLTINNGIDLAGKGGMVWIKRRNGAESNVLLDTVRGTNSVLVTEGSNPALSGYPWNDVVTAFNTNGFTAGASVSTINTYASWTFRKAPKFFDVVTYTGTGSYIDVSHSLGVKPGLIVVKPLSQSGSWCVWARASDTDCATSGFNLNTVDAATYINSAFNGYANASSFNTLALGANIANCSLSGVTYVAYLFAHDTSADGLIQCGSFTTDASGNASVTSLGWEPQFLLAKCASSTGDWLVLDSQRGWNMTANDAVLKANLTDAESTSTEYGNPTATGFDFKGGSASQTYIYMAIRRPNKPPTTGTQVFTPYADAYSGYVTGDSSSSHPSKIDSVWYAARNFPTMPTDNGSMKVFSVTDRVRGFDGTSAIGSGPIFTTPTLNTSATAAETTTSGNILQRKDQPPAMYFGMNYGNIPHVRYAFKRAPGFFDVVCYTGTGNPGLVVPHSLSAIPELILIKARKFGGSGWEWIILHMETARFSFLDNAAMSLGASTIVTSRTSNSITLASDSRYNTTTEYVAYLFATLPGISKIGSYTGNGSSQTINCGFTTGARFVLIKRTDSTGDWYVWDTVRGLTSSTDPHLSMNSTAAEVTTDDSVDPDTSGFIVNQDASTNINVNAGTYLYLAIA